MNCFLFFTTFKCERPNHLLKATNQIEFCFSLISFAPQFPDPKGEKKKLSAFCHIKCSEKLQNIFEIGLKKCGVIEQNSLSEKNYFEIKKSQTLFCCLYVKLASVQI